MADKNIVHLHLGANIIDYFTRKAQEELNDEGETINQIALQRRRARLMVDLLTACYESEQEDE
jgi:hypothetical protein